MPPPIPDAIERYQQRIDKVLSQHLRNAQTEPASRLNEAMQYAVTNGGKRLRPILVYASGEALGCNLETLDRPACAVEFIHAYSLVHDDLPSMDDDELRRGKATCHIRYDEATAILAGDALQALAFSILAEPSTAGIAAARRLQMIRELTQAAGAQGMALGQAIDLSVVGQQVDLDTLQRMHQLKTGALIQASVRLGALTSATIDDDTLNKLDAYAQSIGLAFQIIDDILDVVADTATLGKPQGSDKARNKPTYPALLGLSGARAHAEAMHQRALTSLSGLPQSFDPLRALSHYIVERAH